MLIKTSNTNDVPQNDGASRVFVAPKNAAGQYIVLGYKSTGAGMMYVLPNGMAQLDEEPINVARKVCERWLGAQSNELTLLGYFIRSPFGLITVWSVTIEANAISTDKVIGTYHANGWAEPEGRLMPFHDVVMDMVVGD